MLSYPQNKNFTEIEKKSFVSPFSWIHKYEINDQMYYTWNIFVPKMFKIVLILMTNPKIREYLNLFNGPDFHNKQHAASPLIKFTSSSFQIFIMYLGNFGNLTMKFNPGKYTQNNYKYSVVKDGIILKDKDLQHNHSSNILNAFEFQVPIKLHVNVTIMTLNYFGPNTGYCKYGGVSIYDNITNTLKEILLLCDTFVTQTSHVTVSSAGNLFLIFYSFFPYSHIEFKVKIQPTICKGVYMKR